MKLGPDQKLGFVWLWLMFCLALGVHGEEPMGGRRVSLSSEIFVPILHSEVKSPFTPCAHSFCISFFVEFFILNGPNGPGKKNNYKETMRVMDYGSPSQITMDKSWQLVGGVVHR